MEAQVAVQVAALELELVLGLPLRLRLELGLVRAVTLSEHPQLKLWLPRKLCAPCIPRITTCTLSQQLNAPAHVEHV